MTDRDLMPFGKHKGTPMCKVPKSYLTWLADQDGFEDKNPEMFLYITEGASASSSESERDMDDVEERLLKDTTEDFRKFWFRSYGERLRKNGGDGIYLSYLRVAIATWTASKDPLAGALSKDQQSIPKPTGPLAFGTPMPPIVPKTPPVVARPKILDAQLDEDVPF